MSAYLLRRIGTSIIILIGVSILIYGMMHLVYPSPARAALGTQAKEVAIKAWNQAHGYDQPVFEQYLHWVWKLLHGNLGYSYIENQPVLALFTDRAPRSVWLSGSSLVLAVVIALPLGIYQALRRNTVGDHVATTVAFVLYSMPVFLLGLLLIQGFALNLHIFNVGLPAGENALPTIMADWKSMTIPIATLTLISVASYSRYMRSSAMDVLAQDYIKVARAKGLPERLVLFRHLLRNASLPMVTLLGLSLPALLTGNLIAEQLFNYNGTGILFDYSLTKGDYPVLMAYTMMAAVLVVLGNFIADLSLAAADPRIRIA